MKIAIVNASPGVYNLAAHRAEQYFKISGEDVKTADGDAIFLPDVFDADKVLFSCIFTWDLPAMVRNVNLLRERGMDIEIGGPAATAMRLWIKEQTGIEPHRGLDERFEHMPGDYKMSFTTRGCRNKCPYCVVRLVEPEYLEYDDFSVPVGANPYIGDNNILCSSWEHQELVVERLKDVRNLDINSGFEAALFTEEHYQLFSRLHLERWRLAFDTMEVESDFRRAVSILKAHNISYNIISVFVLIGFPGTTMEEAIYRLETVRALGCTPYPQRYVPLNFLGRRYVAPGFDDFELERLRSYWVSANVWRSCTWEEYQGAYKPPNGEDNPRLL